MDEPDEGPGSGIGAPAIVPGGPSSARSGERASAAPARVPFVAGPDVQMLPPGLAPTHAGVPPAAALRRPQGRRRGASGPVAVPTTSRARPQSRSEEETLAAGAWIQPKRRWGRQRVRVVRSTSSRRMVRRVDTWTVFKVSLFFYLLGLVILLVAGVILWNVASTFGTITGLEKSIRSLFDLTHFQIKPRPLLEYTAAGGIVLAVLGTIMNTVAALIYNLIADIAGGVQIVVVTEPD